MKKILILSVAVLALSGLNAQMVSAQSTSVPTGVKIAHKDVFKSATVQWTSTPQYYIAKWDAAEKQHMTAYYSAGEQNALVRTEKDVQLTDLTTGTQTIVTQKFLNNGGTYTLNRAFKVENSTEISEGVEFNMGNGTNDKISVFFDAQGNMTKREISH